MLEELLLPPVATADAFADPPDAALFPEEEAVIARAADKRRREFTTVRSCARAALARIGVPPVPLLPGLRGAPGWPAGVVGSMTHCAGYRAAAVARADQVITIGLDAEPNKPLPDGVLASIATSEERDWLCSLPAGQLQVNWDRLLFSVKESVYKAWFPLIRRWLEFEEMVVTFQPATSTFAVRLLAPGPTVNGQPLTGFTGGWLARDGLLVTAIVVGHPSRSSPCCHAAGNTAR